VTHEAIKTNAKTMQKSITKLHLIQHKITEGLSMAVKKRIKRMSVFIILVAMLLPILASACENRTQSELIAPEIFTSFKDVPSITEEEIAAIDALRQQNRTFIYGMPLSIEAFENELGEIKGFTASFTDWLSELFGLRFQPMLFEWLDLLDGLETGEISFTGELTANPARLEIYHMTSAIATRPLKYFHLVGSKTHEEIIAERLLRCGFIEGTATVNTVSAELIEGTFEVITLSDVSLVPEALRSGKIDAFFYTGTAEANFVEHSDIVASHFYPLIYRPVSLTTQDDELEPIISVVDKVLENGGMHYLTTMYNQAYQDYLRYRLYTRLTEEELQYIRDNPVVRIGIDPDNYPGCFYDRRESEWKGISLDILDEVAELTGLTFYRVNDETAEWGEIVSMLTTGVVDMVPEMDRTAERVRRGHYIWSEAVQMTDYYALISDYDFPDIKINEVMHVKVGLANNTSYTSLFHKWFPDHNNTVEYDTIADAFAALRRGEIDMVMANQKRLLYLTHYQELPNYKVNVVFDYAIDVRFAYHRNKETLASIIDKAMEAIDTQGISDSWLRKTYDYRINVAEAQRPLLIGISVLFMILLILTVILFVRSRLSGKRLETLVTKRTHELEDALVIAEHANQAKTDFLAHMSHEIRTPMNSIVGFSELALDGNISPKTKRYLTNILGNSEGLLQIINDILDISKIESGKMELENVPFDPHELFASCRTLVMPKAKEKGLRMHFYAEPPIGKTPLGDPTRLRQVIVNLLSNAVKFTEKGMVRLEAAIKEQSENTVTVSFEVRDTGIGMAPEQLEKVFEPFVQAETGTTRKYGGTGLGLSITKNILEVMGGELIVESAPGVGTRFTFELTFDTIDNTEAFVTRQLTQTELKKPTFSGEVLLCEDNAMNQQVITEHLARIGLTTTVAENGEVGVNMVRSRIENGEKLFDLIFMDMHMPVMDGLEASSIIHEMKTGVPIIAMTANIMSSDKELYEMSGMSGYVGKPFTSQELWHCLLEHIDPISWEDVDEIKAEEDDDELRMKLIDKFIESNRTKYEEIVEAINTGDIKLAHRLAHTLKSNAGQLRKSGLQSAVEEVEKNLKDGQNNVTTMQMERLEAELKETLIDLESLVKIKEQPTEGEPLDAEAALKLLNELEPKLKDDNLESLSYVENLKKIPGSEELIKQIENFDFKLATETLTILRKKIHQ